MILRCIYFAIATVTVVHPCMQTFPPEGTTTLPPVTTSTLPTTSTTAAGCNACKANQIDFHKKVLDTETDALYEEETDPATGCIRLIAKCEASKPGFFAFMEFNTGIGGPGAGLHEPVVLASLDCKDGQWWYNLVMENGNPPLPVTKVRCQEAPNPTVNGK